MLGREVGGRGSSSSAGPAQSGAAGLHHVVELLGHQRLHVRDVVHAVLRPQVALDLEGAAQNGAHDHLVLFPAAPSIPWLRHVAVRLLRHVGQIDAEAEHVAAVPLMLLSAELAGVGAEGGAQAFAS